MNSGNIGYPPPYQPAVPSAPPAEKLTPDEIFQDILPDEARNDLPPSYEEATRNTKSKGSIWSDIGSAAGKVCAFPFRAASSAVNGSLFAGYYVATMAATGLAAAAGTAYGIGDMGRNYLSGNQSVKSLSEYAITPAKTTFNSLSRLYNELPEDSTEIIFAGVAVAAVIAGVIIGLKNQSDSDDWYGRRNNFTFINMPVIHNHRGDGSSSSSARYEKEVSKTASDSASFLTPYKVFTDFGISVMEHTKGFVNGKS